ncbi:MAG: hypothetical protein K2O18_16455 [Oscillospiraceae bacterium]|nr:hypothetical protein [Oscillospiraceae bacterium]
MKVFCAEAFLTSESGKRLKAVLGDHIGLLDGKPVQETGSGFGRIEYEANGESWELYPVMSDWCVEDAQERLF